MTEIYRPSIWQRITWQLPRIIKVRVYPAKVISGYLPPDYDEWIIAWGRQVALASSS